MYARVYHAVARRLAPRPRPFSGLQAITEHWETTGQGEVRHTLSRARTHHEILTALRRAGYDSLRFRWHRTVDRWRFSRVCVASSENCAFDRQLISARGPGQGGTVVLATAVQSRDQARACRAARDCSPTTPPALRIARASDGERERRVDDPTDRRLSREGTLPRREAVTRERPVTLSASPPASGVCFRTNPENGRSTRTSTAI